MMDASDNEKGDSCAPKFPAVVELNIGGHHFTTLLQTLTKEPGLLADMFSGKHDLMKDEHGRYFIDADGSMFAYILNFLRVEQLPPNEVASDVCRHAEYFGIQSLVSKLQQQTTTPKEQEKSPKAAAKVRKKSLDTSPSKIQKTSSDAFASSEQKSTLKDQEASYNLHEEENKTNLIVNYLPQTLTDAAFSALFIPMGPIKTMKICRDKGGRSYGFGFVDFRNPEDADRAIHELNGKQIMNKTIKVALVQKRDSGNKGASICVKNLPKEYTATELKDLFSEFGNIVHTNVLKNSKAEEFSGILGFVVFEKDAEAERAIEKMNGKTIPGSDTELVVKLTEENTTNKTKPVAKRPNLGPGIMGKAPVQMTGSVRSGMMGNIPSQMIGNRPGLMAPHGPRPLMGNRMDSIMSNSPRPLMSNMGNDMMNNRPGLMGQGPRQMMANGQGNMNNRMMGHMEGFLRNSAPGSMRNVQNHMAQQQSPPFAHKSGLSHNSYFNQHAMGMNRPDMPKPLTSLGCTLYVNNVGHECDQTDLYRLFAPYGALIKVDVMMEKDSDRCIGYAFVTFMNMHEAEMAIQMLNGTSFKGRTLQVSFKK